MASKKENVEGKKVNTQLQTQPTKSIEQITHQATLNNSTQPFTTVQSTLHKSKKCNDLVAYHYNNLQ